jgi:tetratricopeptide (TPR) repeat protein
LTGVPLSAESISGKIERNRNTRRGKMRFFIVAFLLTTAFVLAPCARANDKDKADQHFKDGVAFLEKGQFERASYHLNRAYSLDANWEYLEYIAKTWSALDDYQNAVHALDAYLEKGGGKIPAKKRKWAKGVLERLEEISSNQVNNEEAQAHLEKGKELYRQHRYEKAAIELEQAYDLSPNWEFLELMGKIEAALKNYDRAVDVYKKFLSLSGDNISQARKKAAKKDLENLETLIKLEEDRKEAPTHYKRGKTQLEMGQYKEAARSLELAYRLYPNWKYLEDIGEALAGAKSYRRAVNAYRTFLIKGSGKISEETQTGVLYKIAALTNKINTGSEETEDGFGEEAGARRDGQSFDWDPKKRFWTWIIGGVGVAGFAGAIITSAIANNEQDRIDEICPRGVCPPSDLEEMEERQDTVNKQQLATRILAGVGAVGVAVGITLFFVEPQFSTEKNPEVSLAPLLDGENAGMMIVGRF